MERICIYPKDIHVLTGKSERWGREIIKKIKNHFSKENNQLGSIDEFCQFTGLPTNIVKEKLNI